MEESPSLARLCGARKDCQAADRSEATVLSEPLLQPVHHRPGKKLRGMYSVITVACEPPPPLLRVSSSFLLATGPLAPAVLECLVGYCLVGTFGYLAYPKDVESNVLNSFPHGEVIIQVPLVMQLLWRRG